MQPAFRPGDRVIAVSWLAPRVGDVVVFRDPESPRTRALIKRVERVNPDGSLQVRADNPNVSRDSRHFGPVARSLVIGRVVYRYLPGERRGRL